MDNLIDWHVENKVTAARTRWEVKGAIVDEAPLAIVCGGLVPILILLHVMF